MHTFDVFYENEYFTDAEIPGFDGFLMKKRFNDFLKKWMF